MISVAGRSFGPIKIEGQYALVPLRLYENLNLTGAVALLGQLPEAMPAPSPAVAAEPKPVQAPAPKATTKPKK